MSEATVRWFDHEKTIGVPLNREDGVWIFRFSKTEHYLEASELRRMLRAMRRLRDFEAGRQARRAKEETRT